VWGGDEGMKSILIMWRFAIFKQTKLLLLMRKLVPGKTSPPTTAASKQAKKIYFIYLESIE